MAELEDEIAGHVALHERSSPPVLDLARRATGLGDDGLCVVARLFVSPRHRRRGVGRALLEAATAEAHKRGLRPVLDVVSGHEAAICLYERCGWVRAGEVKVRWGNYPEATELVYLGPNIPTALYAGDLSDLR